MCIGDQGNDLAMLKYAGLGVAMEMPSEEVKKSLNSSHFLMKSTVLQSLSINLFKHDFCVYRECLQNYSYCDP